ncbi:MAG: DUF3153 domain-containing protein [Spirulinaceae cyanobacterium]
MIIETKSREPHFFPYRSLFFALVFLITLLLSGCVRYDLGVNFAGLHQGEIVQHIKLSDQLANFSQSEAQQWLDSIKQRTQELQGKTERISDQEIVATIPFYNAQDLAKKFNQFFNPNPEQTPQTVAQDNLDLVQLKSQMEIKQNNWLLFQRNRLSLDLDLRALDFLNSNTNVAVSPGSLINLEFVLNTPWGARSVAQETNALIPAQKDGSSLVWKLQPGEVNHIEALFWLPSTIGIGSLVILAFVILGFYFKYKSFPWTDSQTVSPLIKT